MLFLFTAVYSCMQCFLISAGAISILRTEYHGQQVTELFFIDCNFLATAGTNVLYTVRTIIQRLIYKQYAAR